MGALRLSVGIARPLRSADSAERIIRARRRRGLRVTHPSKPLQILRTGRTATNTLTHTDGGQLCRAWKLVHLAVLVCGQAVCKECVSGEAEVGAAALVADEAAFGVLGEAPVDPGADGLTDARRSLASVFASRRPVVAQTDSV